MFSTGIVISLKLFHNVNSLSFTFVILDMKCHGFPGPGYEAGIVANPMREFIHPVDDSHLHNMYADFVDKYNQHEKRSLDTSRKHSFKHNLR